MCGTAGSAQSNAVEKKLPIEEWVGRYNTQRLVIRAGISMDYWTKHDFNVLKAVLTKHYPEYEPCLYEFLCDLGEAMALVDMYECGVNGRGEFIDRSDVIQVLCRDYVFVSDPNSTEDRTVQSRAKAEKYVRNFEIENMEAAEVDAKYFGADLSRPNWPRYEKNYPQGNQGRHQAIRKRYHNFAFRGVSESFVGWDAFRDRLYVRMPTTRRKAILNALRWLRVQGACGDENALLLPWVERRRRKEHRTRAQVELFAVKIPKPQTAKSLPVVDINEMGHSVSSQSPSTQPSESSAQAPTPNDNRGTNMANEPMQADMDQSDENVVNRSSDALLLSGSPEQPAGLPTSPQDIAPDGPLQTSSSPQGEMSRWIHDVYYKKGFCNTGGSFMGWKSFTAKLLAMKPANEHAQVVSELTRLRKSGHAESLPHPPETQKKRAKARGDKRAMHGSTQTSTPQHPNPNTVSSPISTVPAPSPNDMGWSSSAPEPALSESSAMQVPTMSQSCDPGILASEPVGEVFLSSPPLLSEKSTSPAQPSDPPHPSLQRSDSLSSKDGWSIAESTAPAALPSSTPHVVHITTLQSAASPLPLAEQPAMIESSAGSQSARFQAALASFSAEQQIRRETIFNFGQSVSPVNGKSSNIPLFVSGGAQPALPDRGERKYAKLEDSTASDKMQLNGGEQSTKQTSGESTANTQPDPIGRSGSAQSASHTLSSSKKPKTSGDTTQQASAPPMKKDSAPIAAKSSKAPSGKEPTTASTSISGPHTSITNGHGQPTIASASAPPSGTFNRTNGYSQPSIISASASIPNTSHRTGGHGQRNSTVADTSASAPTNLTFANGHSQPATQGHFNASVQSANFSDTPDFSRFSLLLKKGRNGGKANIIERDIRQGPLLSGEIVEKYSTDLVPQYGLLGSLAGYDVSLPSSQVFSNPSTPFSAFICGVQGSGKSHTTACLLENSMICSENIGRLHGSVSSLVFSYGSSDGGNISEVAYLGASKPGFDNHHAKRVTVLVSPSNKAIGKRYEELPNVKAIPFYLNANTLTIHAMTKLMAFDEKAVKPMYMSIVEAVLRNMASNSLSDDAPLNYQEFRQKLKKERLDPKQRKTLDNRLKVLESFLDLTGRFPQPEYAAGEITIMDLSDNQLSSATACVLFKLGMENFLKSSATGKMVVLDEAHKYMGDTPGANYFTDGLARAIREMRHEGLRVIISTQEPTVANELIALCSITIIHRFSSPTWYSALKRHIIAMDDEKNMLRQIENLSTGEALVYAPTAVMSQNKDGSLVKATGQFLKIDVRDRVTEDGGESRLAA